MMAMKVTVAAVPVVVAAVGHIAAPVTAASMVRTTTSRVKRTLHLQMRVRSCQWCSLRKIHFAGNLMER